MRINLDHAHVFASDCGATVDFFQTMFGAELVWDETVADARVVRLRLGKGFINIYDQPPRAPRGGAVHHLGIETDDLDGLVKSMADSGHEFRNKIREEPTFKYIMVAGPDDLLIELFECFEPVRWGIKVSEPQP